MRQPFMNMKEENIPLGFYVHYLATVLSKLAITSPHLRHTAGVALLSGDLHTDSTQEDLSI